MRGEQGTCLINIMQMLTHRRSDGQAIIGRRAAAYLIKDDE